MTKIELGSCWDEQDSFQKIHRRSQEPTRKNKYLGPFIRSNLLPPTNRQEQTMNFLNPDPEEPIPIASPRDITSVLEDIRQEIAFNFFKPPQTVEEVYMYKQQNGPTGRLQPLRSEIAEIAKQRGIK